MKVYTPDQQGTGAFDGGKITEIKPIPFPHESGGIKRTGPLLYWAWASARGEGVIGLHPHQGFEIISYVLEGSVGHTDSAGNNRRVSAGGAQLMQTGSGISHREEMYGDRTEFFQIWFEPDLRQALRREPVYLDQEDRDFLRTELPGGGTIKNILGHQGSMEIAAPARWDDIVLVGGEALALTIEASSSMSLMTVNGDLEASNGNQSVKLTTRDFGFEETTDGTEVQLKAGPEGARFHVFRVPVDPGYPLYRG